MDEIVDAQNLTAGLGLIDLAVVLAVVSAFLVIAWFSGRKEQDTADFFVARRRVPGFIACLSFVAAEVSAMTLLAVPATGYHENWQ
jgi:solute:Na+ symporter, SSS family